MKNHKIGVGAVKIDPQSKKYINRILATSRLTYGYYSRRFEEEFARIHERKFAVFCNSGTSALQVGFDALKKKNNWKDGSEVIVPALTFVASINTVLQNKLTPVFVDIEADYFGVDPQKIEAAVSPNTVCIEPVHLFGQPADMDSIMDTAKKFKLAVLEDSCETMFSKYHGKVAGSFGDIACFSTYAAHLLTTGVGGFAVTNDNDLAILIKSLFNHGRDGIYLHIDDDEVSGEKLKVIVERRFNFTNIGYSYRATEFEAALGVAQLKLWPKMIKKRQDNANYLTRNLSIYSDFLQLPKVRPNTEHVYMVYPIVVRENLPAGKAGRIKPLELIFYLEKRGIETRFLLPTLTQPIYKKLFGNIGKKFPVALEASQRGFYIGVHHELKKEDLDYILEVFSDFFKKYKKI